MPDKILIVDDDEPTRAGLAMLLTEAGYETITAASVPAAIKLLSEREPDLLLVDIRLDAYNGLHLVAMRPRPIPAIVVTGYADPAIEADARRLGAEFLLKPVAPKVLTAVINRLLTNTHAQAGSPPRRWPRKSVGQDLRVEIGDASARLVDVSYGGVCVEVHRTGEAGPPGAFQMVVPRVDIPVPVQVVWTRRRDETTWLCGGVIGQDASLRWRDVVDSLA